MQLGLKCSGAEPVETVHIMLCSQMYVMYAGGGQKVQVKNLDLLRHATLGRPKGTPLVTVSNHASCLDDPAVWGKPVSA